MIGHLLVLCLSIFHQEVLQLMAYGASRGGGQALLGLERGCDGPKLRRNSYSDHVLFRGLAIRALVASGVRFRTQEQSRNRQYVFS